MMTIGSRTAGQFEIHCDTPDDLVERMLHSNLRQINQLKIVGRCESYFFTSGVWTCTQLCRSALATKMVGNNGEIGVYTHLYSRCPDRTIYNPKSGGNNTVRIKWRDICCDHWCTPRNSRGGGHHSFESIAPDEQLRRCSLIWGGMV